MGRSDPGSRSLCRSDDSAAGVRFVGGVANAGVDEAVVWTGRDRERERSERGVGFTPLVDGEERERSEWGVGCTPPGL